MIRQVAIGLLAGALAVIALTLARPIPPPHHLPGEWLEANLELPRIVRLDEPPTTRPVDTTDAALDVIIDEVDFKQVHLRDFIEFLQARVKPNVVVNWRALEAAGIGRDYPINVQLRNVTARKLLTVALHDCSGGNIKLAYRAEQNVVFISTADDLERGSVTVVYSVRDLLSNSWPTFAPAESPDFSFPPSTRQSKYSDSLQDRADALVRLIQETIDPTTWRDNGGISGMRMFNGLLIVTAAPEAHAQLRDLLAQLRHPPTPNRK